MHRWIIVGCWWLLAGAAWGETRVLCGFEADRDVAAWDARDARVRLSTAHVAEGGHALEVILALWDSLAEAGPSPGALRAVELALLELAGHQPALDRCAACGETALETGAVFDPTRGGAICRRCAARSRGPNVRPMDPAARAYLRAVSDHGAPAAARAVDTDPRFQPADRAAARDALIAMVGSLVARPLRSLEYIAKLGY